MSRKSFINDALTIECMAPAFAPRLSTPGLPPSDAHPHLWIWVVGAVFLVGIVIAGLVITTSAPTLTLALRPDNTDLRPGDTLVWQQILTTSKATDISSSVELVDVQTGASILGQDDAFTVTRRDTMSKKLVIPADVKPGRYALRTTLQADAAQVMRSFVVTVLPPVGGTSLSTCANGVRDSDEADIDCGGSCSPCGLPARTVCIDACDDGDPCTIDSCNSETCTHQPTSTCCGDLECELGETTRTCPQDCNPRPLSKTSEDIITDALALSESDAEKAATLCNSISLTEDADNCHHRLAIETEQHIACTNIRSEDVHDKCLLTFALDKNRYDACALVRNKYLKNSCYSLKNLRT